MAPNSTAEMEHRVTQFKRSLRELTDESLFKKFREMRNTPESGKENVEELHLQVLMAADEIKRRFPDRQLLVYEDWLKTRPS